MDILTDRRPALTDRLSGHEFRRWYWLKEELVAFCRTVEISTGGGKAVLADRIEAFLDGKVPTTPQPVRAQKKAKMPVHFSPDDRIGAGWTCSVALSAFFKAEFGPGFRFNKAMRDFIHHGEGRTIAEAMERYRQSLCVDRETTEIAPQFEYNRHMREYFASHPDATRDEAIATWWDKRGNPSQ